MYNYNILHNQFPWNYIWELIFGNPESLVVKRQFEDLDLEFDPRWCFDYVNIN